MKKLVVVLLGLMGTLAGLAAQNNGFVTVTNRKEVEAKLTKASVLIKTINSEFVQKKHLEYLDEVIESKGKFLYRTPSQLRWEYTEPFEYMIVLSNGLFTVKEGGKKSEFDLKKNRAFKELNDIIVSSVNGTLIESDRFKIEIKESASQYLVVLDPVAPEMKSVLSCIELYFSKVDLNVEKTRMIESKEDFTEILFVKRIYNQPIPDGAFVVK